MNHRTTTSSGGAVIRSKSGDAICRAKDIYKIASSLLNMVEKRPIRLVGISLSSFMESDFRQLTIVDMDSLEDEKRKESPDASLLALQRRYGGKATKTEDKLIAEKRLEMEKCE